MAESKIPTDNLIVNDLLVSQDVASGSQNIQITIPNRDKYKFIVVLIYADSNNGLVYTLPAITLPSYTFPFSITSTNGKPTYDTSGYSMFCQGNIRNNTVTVYRCTTTGWDGITVRVYGVR